VRPDYPTKFFPDKRNSYVLLLESLAGEGGLHYNPIKNLVVDI